jgi:hypothetical protein
LCYVSRFWVLSPIGEGEEANNAKEEGEKEAGGQIEKFSPMPNAQCPNKKLIVFS